jgi:hypothetical protein
MRTVGQVEITTSLRQNGWWLAYARIDGFRYQAEARSKRKAIQKIPRQLHTIETVLVDL